jgi:serine/threonine protein phosphatase PrpC
MTKKLFGLIRGRRAKASDTRDMESPFSHGIRSFIGLHRTTNQDGFGVFPEMYQPAVHPKGQMFLVADGMGGLIGGQRASEIAVTTIRQVYFEHGARNIPQNLADAFERANAMIFDEAHSKELEHNMGTTCSALVLTDERGYIAHVGDSRIYRIRGNELEQLTQDHTVVEEMFKNDLIEREDAALHPGKSVLSRALGIEREVQVDLLPDVGLEQGDRFVLCTDGLAKVEADELKDIVCSMTPQEACDALVELACQRGGADNITVLVVRIDDFS